MASAGTLAARILCISFPAGRGRIFTSTTIPTASAVVFRLRNSCRRAARRSVVPKLDRSRLELGRKTWGAKIGVQRILEQLHDLRRPCRSTIGLSRANERLRRE